LEIDLTYVSNTDNGKSQPLYPRIETALRTAQHDRHVLSFAISGIDETRSRRRAAEAFQ
jgi:hypothetical protein